MQQYMCRAYLFFDEAAHQVMIETPYCNAAVVGGDRIEWLREHGATVVQADTLEELATKVQTETVKAATSSTPTASSRPSRLGTRPALPAPPASSGSPWAPATR